MALAMNWPYLLVFIALMAAVVWLARRWASHVRRKVVRGRQELTDEQVRQAWNLHSEHRQRAFQRLVATLAYSPGVLRPDDLLDRFNSTGVTDDPHVEAVWFDLLRDVDVDSGGLTLIAIVDALSDSLERAERS